MRVERVYDWTLGEGITETDPRTLDPSVQAGSTIRIGHLSDTHLGKGESGVRRTEMRRWFEALEGLDAEVIVHTGDLVESPDDEESIEWAFSMMETIDAVVVGVPGNHDLRQPGQPEEVTRRWGPFPRIEIFGGLQLALADSMMWPGVDERSRREREAAEETGFYSAGGVGPDQRQKLTDQLDESFGGARILAVHHHVRQPVPPKPWYEKYDDLMRPMDDADAIVDLARDRGVTLIMHGHRHQYVPPFAPFDDLVVLNADCATREQSPQRARLIDMATDGEAMRIWELVRF